MNKTIYFYKGSNIEVIDFYFSIIEKAFLNNGWIVEYVSDMNTLFQLNRKSFIFVAELRHSLPLIIRGYFNIIYWFQGVTPEEDFLRKKSYIRFYALRLCEYITLKISKINLFVSDRLLSHYRNTFKLKLENSFIMPCFNVKGVDFNAFSESKYKQNTFCYVGSLSVWQCFPKTISLYKEIENADNTSFLKVFTSEKKKALDYLEQMGVKNFSVDFVKPEKLHESLSDCKFGFIIRDDILVNNVATPTKMSSYLSSGVIPIFSDCICDFKKYFSNYKYFVPLSNNDNLNVNSLPLDVDILQIQNEYSHIYDTYYNENCYILNLSNTIKKFLGSFNC